MSFFNQERKFGVLARIFNMWMKLGDILHRISSFVVSFILYFLVVTPLGLFAKIFFKNYMGVNFEKSASYWITTDTESNLEEQF